MLYLLYTLSINRLIPSTLTLLNGTTESVTTLIIILGGLSIALTTVGIKTNMCATVIGGFASGLNWLFKKTLGAIGSILQYLFTGIPKFFNWSRKGLINYGLDPIVSVLVSVVMTILLIVVII